MTIQRCIWRLHSWSTKGNSDDTTLERTVELAIVAFDIDLFFVTILLLLNRKQH